MSIRRLVLHVGLPKTGTTALQVWCHLNRERLITQNIRYPILGTGNGAWNHQFVVQNLFSNQLDQIDVALAEGNEETIVLSAEGMTNHLYDYRPAALSRFRSLTARWEVCVFMVQREAGSWLKSYYRQCAINPPVEDFGYATELDFAEFIQTRRVRRLIDSWALREDVIAAYGASGSEFHDYAGDWIDAFIRFVGADADGFPPIADRHQSISDDLTALVVEINRLRLPERARAAWLVAIRDCFAIDNVLLTMYANSFHGGSYRSYIDIDSMERITLAGDQERAAIDKLRDFLEAA